MRFSSTAIACSARSTTPRTWCRRRSYAPGVAGTASRDARPSAVGSTGSPPTPASTPVARTPDGCCRRRWAYPDAALEGIADVASGTDARYEMNEAVQFAFVAAIQELPPRQRAVLLLRDVLGWSAGETAVLLDASVASINSAPQRARATLKHRFPSGRPGAQPMPDDHQRRLLEPYETWEDSNLEGFVALLREDAVLSMPPWRQWYAGRTAIKEFMAWVWRPDRRHHHLVVPRRPTGSPPSAATDLSVKGRSGARSESSCSSSRTARSPR